MAKEHRFEGTLEWVGASEGPTSTYQSYSREFRFTGPGKPVLHGSAAGAYRGDESLLNPEELLMIAVSSCHMLSYLALCALAKIEVTSYTDSCVAVMSIKDGKMRITESTLRPVIGFAEGTDLDKARELHHKAHEECFIASSVNFPIHLELTF